MTDTKQLIVDLLCKAWKRDPEATGTLVAFLDKEQQLGQHRTFNI